MGEATVHGRTRPPVAVLVAGFVSSFDRFAVSPLLVLVAADFGVGLAQALAAASGYFLAYGLCQPLWGVLSDRFGRIRLMRATLLAGAVTGVLSALAPSLAALVATRAFTGGLFGAIVPTTLTYVGDTVADDRRQSALSDLMAALGVGTALATAAAGALAQLAGWRVVFAVPSVIAVACAVALGRSAEPAREARPGFVSSVRQAARERWVLVVVGLVFVEGAVVLGGLTVLAPALQRQGVDASGAGLATAAYGVSVLLATRVVKALTRHTAMPRLMAVGGAAVVLGYATLALGVSVPTVLAAAFLLGVTWAFLHVSLQTWATALVPSARGTVVSLFAASLFAGSSVGAWAAGLLGEDGRWSVLFGITAGVALALTVLAVLAARVYDARTPT